MTEGNILLVTGASSDIGVAYIRDKIDDYAFIWAHYSHGINVINELKEAYGDKIIPIQADFADYDSTSRFISFINNDGRIPTHILHVAAPPAVNKQFHRCEWSDFELMINVSFRSIEMIINAFIPYMVKARNGHILFVLSAYTIGNPPSFQSVYVSIKYALLGLLKCLTSEYAGKGIVVNGISPEMIQTKYLDNVSHLIVEKNATDSPIGRNLQVNDLLSIMELLLSDDNATINGQNVGITSGIRL